MYMMLFLRVKFSLSLILGRCAGSYSEGPSGESCRSVIEVCVVGVYFICASVSSIMKIFIDPVSDELGEAFDDKPYLSLTQSFLPRVSCRLIVWPLLSIIMLLLGIAKGLL